MNIEQLHKLNEIAAKFTPELLVNYIPKADPNEGFPRDLLELAAINLKYAKDSEQRLTMNEVFKSLIERGLDMSRPIHTMAIGDNPPPSIIQFLSNTQNATDNVIKAALRKNPDITLASNSGYNPLLGCIQHKRYDLYDTFYVKGLRLSPEAANVALVILTATCSTSDKPEVKSHNEKVAKQLMLMGANLFETKMYGSGVEVELAERGYHKLASIIEKVKLHTTMNRVSAEIDLADVTPEEQRVVQHVHASRGL